MSILDVPGLNKTSADARYIPGAIGSLSLDVTMPSSLGWDTTAYPLTATVTELAGTQRALGSVSLTPEAAFDAVSTARTSPGATYYVDVSTGNDSNPGTSGSQFKSIWKAIAAANTAGVPTKIIVTPSTYYRTNNPWYNGGAGVTPTVDIALLANGGRVLTGTFDPPGTPSRDSTYTNCYVITVASVNRVVNLSAVNTYGNYIELTNVATAAIANITPDSWCLASGTLYINRRDQVAVTNSNTRYFRPATSCIAMRAATNLYVGGIGGNAGFDCEGGSSFGVFDSFPPAPSSGTKNVIAVVNSSFKYGGGVTDTTAKGVSVNSHQGLAYFSNCRADAAISDGFNFHNTNPASELMALTVNCTGYDNGRAPSTSNNGWTSHENVTGIDIAGHYSGGYGGTCRSINSSKTWFAGTFAENDHGDQVYGGVVPPTAFRADDTAIYWCDRCRVTMPAATYGYVTGSGTATIYRRNCRPSPLIDFGPGTITSY